MKIDFTYNNNKDFVYVWIGSEVLGVSDHMIFEYEDFYKRYRLPADFEKLKEDMVDTLMNVMSLPFSKDKLMKDMKLGIYSDLFKYAKSTIQDKVC